MNFKLVLKNSGDGVLSHGIQEHPNGWMRIEQEVADGTGTTGTAANAMNEFISNSAQSSYPSTVTYNVDIRTGDIQGQVNQEYEQQLSFWWTQPGGRSGSKTFKVKVTIIENNNMLVFPFSIEESVVAGTKITIPVFVFNINSNTFFPWVDDVEDPTSSFVKLIGDQEGLPCVVSNTATFTLQNNNRYLTAAVNTPCYQQNEETPPVRTANGVTVTPLENTWKMTLGSSTPVINEKPGAKFTRALLSTPSTFTHTGALRDKIVWKHTLTIAANVISAAGIASGVTVQQGLKRGILVGALSDDSTTVEVQTEQGTVFDPALKIIIGTTEILDTQFTASVRENVEIIITCSSGVTLDSLTTGKFLIGQTVVYSSDVTTGGIETESTGAVDNVVCRITPDSNSNRGKFEGDVDLWIGDYQAVITGNVVFVLGQENLQNDAAVVSAASEKAKTKCVTIDGTPFKLDEREYQRIVVELDGNRPSRGQPYTTSILIRGTGGKEASSNNPVDITDAGRVPISMTVTPGPTEPTQSTMEYKVVSSPYSTREKCYIGEFVLLRDVTFMYM